MSYTTDDYCVILTTCPNRESGERIAHLLVEQQLAACVNLTGTITSIYRWRGNIEQDQEILLIIKTTKRLYQSIESTVRQHHPYEEPEVISIDIKQGADSYLQWISESTREISEQ